ncbi:hypothetical protein ACPUER_36720, partial [Burkholderia sp. DN3021]|uniref:hypothetical protein n=1 Tax=Burkholderia sp. DN3021 TaxID=3410137 RepID=UPI003C79E64E
RIRNCYFYARAVPPPSDAAGKARISTAIDTLVSQRTKTFVSRLGIRRRPSAWRQLARLWLMVARPTDCAGSGFWRAG